MHPAQYFGKKSFNLTLEKNKVQSFVKKNFDKMNSLEHGRFYSLFEGII